MSCQWISTITRCKIASCCWLYIRCTNLTWSPDHLTWPPDYLTWPPDHLTWPPDHLTWPPDHLTWPPDYLTWPPIYIHIFLPKGLRWIPARREECIIKCDDYGVREKSHHGASSQDVEIWYIQSTLIRCLYVHNSTLLKNVANQTLWISFSWCSL